VFTGAVLPPTRPLAGIATRHHGTFSYLDGVLAGGGEPPACFPDIGCWMVPGLVARVSGKVDVPGHAQGGMPVGRTIAYSRVSARDQNPQLQLDALAAHGYDQIFTEKQSGKRGAERPAFAAARAALQPGDALVFWKSDRWGRSAAHVLTTIGELRDRGVTITLLTENIDLATKEGRFMFAVLAAAAEYELELRAERQAEGIAAARRRQADGTMLPGKKRIGRPRAVGPAELRQLQRITSEGATVTQAARILKISRSTAYAALNNTPPREQPDLLA
jgi:DNA invertase Pin-like site-specific DNA recombinase